MKTSTGIKFGGIIFLLVMVYGVVNLTSVKDQRQTPRETNQEPNEQLAKPAKKERKSLVSQPANLRSQDPVDIQVPEECEDIWYTITDSHLDDLEIRLAQKDLPMSSSCRQIETQLFGGFTFPKECFERDLGKTLEDGTTMQEVCRGALIAYRGMIVHYLSEGKDPKTLDSQVLINKIMTRWGKDRSAEELVQTISLADLLASREPESYAARKSQIFTRYLKYLKIEPRQVTLGLEIQELSKEIERFGRQDTDIFEMGLIMAVANKDLELLQTRIDKATDIHPESPVPDYYQSAYHWYKGNKDLAIEFAKKAITKGPKTAKYEETLKKLMDNPVGAKGMYNGFIAVFFGDTSVY